MRAFISGAGGFAGSHLSDFLLRETDWELFGCVLPGMDHARLDERVRCLEMDLRDPVAVAGFLKEISPDVIFHLAAQAFVPASWDNPWETLENNIRAQANILNALVNLGTRPRVLIVGSNEEYGLADSESLPLRESSPLRPNSPYAVSKVAQDMLGLAYYLGHSLPVVRVRPFNHIGPRQSERFVVPDFARQIAEMEAGLREPVLRVGNLSARRDFTDVRDVVRAYYLAVSRGVPGEVYNIGSGQSREIREVVGILTGCSRVPVSVEQDPARMRPSDAAELRCDSTRLRNLAGWHPVIPLEQSLRDVLEEWRGVIESRRPERSAS